MYTPHNEFLGTIIIMNKVDANSMQFAKTCFSTALLACMPVLRKTRDQLATTCVGWPNVGKPVFCEASLL